jgi:hypothetical protein
MVHTGSNYLQCWVCVNECSGVFIEKYVPGRWGASAYIFWEKNMRERTKKEI